MAERSERGLTDKRKAGHKGAEQTGKIKTVILCHIYDSNKELTTDEVVDYLQNDENKHFELPLKQKSNIYRHLSELVTKQLIIKEEREDNTNYFSGLPMSLDNFRKICEYLSKTDMFSVFMETNYFNRAFSIYFKDIIKQGLNIELPDTYEKDRDIAFLIKILHYSSTAVTYLILEPERLKEIKPPFVYGDVRNYYGEVTPDTQNDNFALRLFHKQDNIDWSDVKLELIEKLNEEVKEINKIVNSLIPIVGICLRYELFREYNEISIEDIRKNQLSKKYLELVDKEKEFRELTNIDCLSIFKLYEEEESFGYKIQF